MTLGELLEGEEAVECLKKGIEIMITEKETNEKVYNYCVVYLFHVVLIL